MAKRIIVNAGATVIVETEKGTHQYNCSGTNEKTGRTAKEVLDNLRDCIEQASSGKKRKKK